jgi:hypothetical protein
MRRVDDMQLSLLPGGAREPEGLAGPAALGTQAKDTMTLERDLAGSIDRAIGLIRDARSAVRATHARPLSHERRTLIETAITSLQDADEALREARLTVQS